MNLFIRKLGRAFKNVIIFCVLLVMLFLGFVFHEKLFNYVVHGQSFYLVYLGDREYKEKNLQEAIDYYIRALELYPGHVRARYNLANIYVDYEDFPQAIKEYETVLEYDPSYLNARINLGIILAEEVFDFDRAIGEYKKVTQTKVGFINIPLLYDNREQLLTAKAIAHYNMGLAYRDKSMLSTPYSTEYRQLLNNAADSYKNSLKLNPDNYNAQYNYALTAHLLGLYTEALSGYCRAMLVAPLNYEAHYNLAVLLKQRKQYRDAFEQLNDAGSLISYAGDTYRAAHIYRMLTEISAMAIAEYGYRPKEVLKRLGNDFEREELSFDREITINDIEEAIKKRIRTTSICKNYLKDFP